MSADFTAVVKISTPDGWHARPATEFARVVSDSGLQVTIGRAGEPATRGDSVLSLLTLGAKFGQELTITVHAEASIGGPAAAAKQLLRELTQLF